MQKRKKLFILVVFIVLCGLQTSPWITKKQAVLALESDDKTLYYGISKFFDEPINSLDVLFIGDSNFYRGVMPTQIWKESGITSYVIALPSQPSWVAYYELKQALLYQKPSLVVIEANQIFKKKTVKQARMIRYLNSMRNDPVRIEASNNDLFKLSDEFRYNVLNSVLQNQVSDFVTKMNGGTILQNDPGNYKGFILNVKQVPFVGSLEYMQSNIVNYTIDEDNISYVDDLIQLCKDNEIKVLMIKVPDAINWSDEGAKIANDFAETENIPFYDFNTGMQNETIDWYTDSYDGGTHLNVFGAEKLSKEIANYFKQNYAFKRRSSDILSSFETGYDTLNKQKEIMIANGDETDDER